MIFPITKSQVATIKRGASYITVHAKDFNFGKGIKHGETIVFLDKANDNFASVFIRKIDRLDDTTLYLDIPSAQEQFEIFKKTMNKRDVPFARVRLWGYVAKRRNTVYEYQKATGKVTKI